MIALASVGAVVVGGAAFVAGGFVALRSQPTDPHQLIVSAGYYDVLRDREPAAEFRLSYRREVTGWRLRPFAAGMTTTDGALHVCAGIAYDLPVGRRFVLTPSFAPGLYSHGSGLDLGFPVEFRSQLEAALRVGESGARVGVSLSHVSNAHLGDTNPGEESLMLNVGIPLGRRP